MASAAASPAWPATAPSASKKSFPSTTTSTASSGIWWADDRRERRERRERRRRSPRHHLWRVPVIATVYRIVLGGLVTRGRIIVLGLLGIVGVIVGIAVGSADVTDRAQAAADLVNGFGLTVYVPVVTLVFASAALGDPAEDGSLVYLWLRPVARWRIVAGAL